MATKTAPAATKPVPAAKAPAQTSQTEVKETKSVVPAKYAGKYKDGGSGPTAEFIKAQCTGKEGFEFPAFFDLASKNGIAEDKVAAYRQKVADNVAGAPGLARMTLGNMLRALARKQQNLKDLKGKTVDVLEPVLEVKGAAKAAQDAKAAKK